MSRSIRPHRKSVTRYHDAAGKRCTRDTPGAVRSSHKTETWYAKIDGVWTSLKTTDEGRAWDELRRLLKRKASSRTEAVEETAVPLADYLSGYLDHLRAKGRSDAHVALVKQRTLNVLASAGLNCWADIEADKVGKLLAGWRKDPTKGRKKGTTMSAQTSNHYTTTLKAFAAWLARKLKLASPLAELGKMNVAADRRHIRRTLVQEEFAKLLTATERGRALCGLSGVDRVMLYILAAYTGLRASALASLTPAVLRLTADPPTLTLAAALAKSRRERTFPLHADVAARLQAWLAGKPPSQRLWPGRWAQDFRGGKMMKVDLKAAGLPYEDERGRAFDFHALRGQFITALARAGVPLVAAQKLADHCTPALTANYYTHLETEDLAREVAKLPPPPAPGQPQE